MHSNKDRTYILFNIGKAGRIVVGVNKCIYHLYAEKRAATVDEASTNIFRRIFYWDN